MAGRFRRGKLEIKMDILRGAQEPIVPTRLMYACNLSWKPLQSLVGELITAGLLEALIPEGLAAGSEDPRIPGVKPVGGIVFDGRSKIKYALSEKGKAVLAHYRETEELLKQPGKLPTLPTSS